MAQLIIPKSSTTARNVGIGASSINATYPFTTLHVANSGSNSTGSGEITADALNHTYSASNPSGNEWLVFSDGNGTLKNLPASQNGINDVLHGDGSWSAVGSGTGDVTACTASGGTAANFVTKWTSTVKEICVIEIYDDGIGVAINALPFSNATKLTVRGLQASQFISTVWTPATSINSIFNDVNNNDLLQIRDNGTVLIGNGIGNPGSYVDGQLGIGGGFGSPINSRLEIHGSSGGLGRCIEVDDNSSNALFYVYDDGRVGISTNAPNFPLDVQAVDASNVSANFLGDIIAATITTFSDSMFKNNITDISNSVSIVNRLSPRQYNYDTAAFPQMKFHTGNQFGLIAQELEQVIPELIGSGLSPLVTDSMGVVIHPSIPFKTINYSGLIPFLIGAMKAQNQSIDSMRAGMMAMQT